MVKLTQGWVAHGGPIGSGVRWSLGRHDGLIHFPVALTLFMLHCKCSLFSLSLLVQVEEENGCKWFEGKLEV